MYFSDAYPATPTDLDDWFDPLMEVDTQLFVDPFLLFAEASGFWADSSDRLANHFEKGFKLLAGHQENPESLQYKKTVQLMKFPEPREFGLGYVSKGTGGSGTGDKFAQRIVAAMALAIERGLSNLHHFEELGVLVELIGRDRISDITLNILKDKFIVYTQDVCARHGIAVESFSVEHGSFDALRNRWAPATADLPVNPETGGFVLLTPRRFLRELPTLNSSDWWDYVEPTLRDDLNLAIGEKLPKKRIIEIARRHPELVREWSTAREATTPDPYNVDRDPVGLHNWQYLTEGRSEDAPLSLDAIDASNLPEFIGQVNDSFRHFIEQEGGWRLLRNDDTGLPKRESSIQLLYKGVVQSYCRAHNVRLDREVELGRGPIDFIFNSTTERVLLEVKKMRNGEFWNGLDHQLTSYLASDGCTKGWFLAIRLTDSKKEKEHTALLPARTKAAAQASGFDLRSSWVDARPKESASKLDGGEGIALHSDEDPEFQDGE